MKITKFTPFILLAVGTFGLLFVELFTVPESRCFTLTFASLNVLGLLGLILVHKKIK